MAGDASPGSGPLSPAAVRAACAGSAVSEQLLAEATCLPGAEGPGRDVGIHGDDVSFWAFPWVWP